MENKIKTAKQGFASLTPERRKEIARKGGLTISQNHSHMIAMSQKGVEARRIKREAAKTNK